MTLVATGGSIGWQESSLVVGVLATAATWLIGGAATGAAVRSRFGVSPIQARGLTFAWFGAALVAVAAAWRLGLWMESVRVGNVSGPGFLGLVVGVGVGGAVGGGLTGWLAAGSCHRARNAILLGVAAFLGFSLATFVTIIGLVSVGQLTKVALQRLIGPTAGWLIGCGVTGIIGGLVAGWSIELSLRSMEHDSPSPA